MDLETSPRVLTCPVCLRKLRRCGRVGKPDVCSHLFCFPCIREWSKNVNTCPVDRLKFNTIELFLEVNGPLLEKVHVPEVCLQDQSDEANEYTYCEVCSECTQEDRLLLCDGCDKGYHLYCLTPPLSEVPTGDWYCVNCIPIINSQYHLTTLESEQDSSILNMSSEAILSSSCEEVEESDTNDFEMRERGRGYDSNSDISVIGTHSSSHNHRGRVCNKRIMIRESSTSELSVTGESSDEEILATKLRRALAREANIASRIPLVRESSHSGSGTSTSCCEYEAGTTAVVVRRETAMENSGEEIVDVENDEMDYRESSVEFIELDSVTCTSDNMDWKSPCTDDTASQLRSCSTSTSKTSKKNREKSDKFQSPRRSSKYSSQPSNKRGFHSSNVSPHGTQSEKNSRSKQPSFRQDRTKSNSKRRLEYAERKSSGTTNHQKQYGVERSKRGKDRVLQSKGIVSSSSNQATLKSKGKGSVSKSRCAMAARKTLGARYPSSFTSNNSTVSNSTFTTGDQRSRSHSLSAVVADDDPYHSGYTDDSPPPSRGFYSATTSRELTPPPLSNNRFHNDKQGTEQSCTVSNSTRISPPQLRSQPEQLISHSHTESHPNQRNFDSRFSSTRLTSASISTGTKYNNSQSPLHARGVRSGGVRKKTRMKTKPKPRRRRRRRIVPLNIRRQSRKNNQQRGRGRPIRMPRSFARQRNEDPSYNPPSSSLRGGAGDQRPHPPADSTPRTRALARTAATHHSAMREAVRASYRYDSQEMGLKYAREILAQQRRFSPWKSVTPAGFSLALSGTPQSGYCDRTLTPNMVMASSSLSETPRRVSHCSAHLQRGNPAGITSSRLARQRVVRERQSSARLSNENQRTRNLSQQWSDHTSVSLAGNKDGAFDGQGPSLLSSNTAPHTTERYHWSGEDCNIFEASNDRQASSSAYAPGFTDAHAHVLSDCLTPQANDRHRPNERRFPTSNFSPQLSSRDTRDLHVVPLNDTRSRSQGEAGGDRDRKSERFERDVSRRPRRTPRTRGKRYLSEVLVTPVKLDCRVSQCDGESEGVRVVKGEGVESEGVEVEGEMVESDVLSQIWQKLDDLGNKRNIICRDGSIIPIRDDQSGRGPSSSVTPPKVITSPSEHTHSHSNSTEHMVHAPADSTTSECVEPDILVRPHKLQELAEQKQNSVPKLHSTNRGRHRSSVSDSFQQMKMDNSDIFTLGSDESSGDSPSTEASDIIEKCLNRFFKKGKINQYQYKRIFDRSTRKVMEGVQICGRIDVERVKKLVADFVDGYTSTLTNTLK